MLLILWRVTSLREWPATGDAWAQLQTRSVYRPRTWPDRPGPKTEFMEGSGPKTGPDPSRTGPSLAYQPTQVTKSEMWHGLPVLTGTAVPLQTLGRADRATSHEWLTLPLPFFRNFCPTVAWSIQHNQHLLFEQSNSIWKTTFKRYSHTSIIQMFNKTNNEQSINTITQHVREEIPWFLQPF